MRSKLLETHKAMAGRVVKYTNLDPCFDAFIDTRTPGSDQKENFTIIGPGVSENPNQYVHITEPHGFNIGGARQPPGCTNSQHSHKTVEVFYVHSGHWRFDLGEHGEDAQAELGPGDLISIPPYVFRGFTNIGKDTGFLWAILGQDDPGRVLWAPKVFEMAREYGLVLLDNGMLVDLSKGEEIPPGKQQMPVTSREEVKALQRFTSKELSSCISQSGTSGPRGAFDTFSGVQERLLIGQGRMDWPHGFQVSELTLGANALIPPHKLKIPDVYFVQSGVCMLCVDGSDLRLEAGDTATIPIGAARSLKQVGDMTARIVMVRGGDQTIEIEWV